MEVSLRGLSASAVTAGPVPAGAADIFVAPPCPAGYGIPTFSDGLNASIKSGLFQNLLFGPLNLFTSGDSPGNIAGPNGEACFLSARMPFVARLGSATPGLIVIGILGIFLFGGKR